ncbi:unnamed protein product [Rotaria sp. Silwood2]|nr:unnamed protein product [Rotaria sp. Silwood2]CAF4018864.1 unnamed protein product [Rotaria sp. Silwood2]CAF4550917.1 unnamed protein product [Rotaria sp. Silwood2]
MLLRRLHLIDIQPYEFDKLLSNRLIKQLHTLIVDVTDSNPFKYQVVEGAYLAKVCACLPALKICGLPFNYCWRSHEQLEKYSAPPHMSLPNLSNTVYLHTLILGVNTSHFLVRLLACVPFIQNLSIVVEDRKVIDDEKLPLAVDARHSHYLSRLTVKCIGGISFHRTTALLSSVFGQLNHLFLSIDAYTTISGLLFISGDMIQQACIDRLKPSASYALDLSLHVEDDLVEKKILNSFIKAPFGRRERPMMIIQGCNYCMLD